MGKRPIKKIGFCNFHRKLNVDNFLFENANTTIGDDLLKPMQELRRQAAERGVTVATVDVMALEDMDILVFIDMPDKGNRYFRRAREMGIPLYLMILESPLLREENYDPANHRHFSSIFTYDDSIVDGSFYIKLNYAFSFPETMNWTPIGREKLCVVIAGNKRSRHPLELYSERIRAIRWFEQHHPADFDLYGIGWDSRSFKGMKPSRFLNPVKVVKKLLAPRYPSYRGTVVRKRPVLERYKFSLCYENIRDVPGYITEKIFDSFFAGCVPVYLGANNITSHIPSDCFIDRRQFETYEELYDFMTTMPETRYRQYQENIVRFIQSDRARFFSIDHFVETVLDTILRQKNSPKSA